MKRIIAIAVLLLLIAGCSPIQPTAPEEMRLKVQSKSVAAANVKCQAGSTLSCIESIEGASSFFLLVRTVQATPDWREDARFDYAAATASLQRCRDKQSMCPTLSEIMAGQVKDYMDVIELE